MGWFRTRRSFGCGLALFALAVQLVLSFGHAHLDKLSFGSTNAAVAGAKSPASQPSPTQHPDHGGDGYCAICAVIHLASSSLLPDAPRLPLLLVSQQIEHSGHFVFPVVAPQRTAFRSRAPPRA
jgi:hypothetical protein